MAYRISRSYSESLIALKDNRVDLLNDYSSSADSRTFVLETKPVLTTPFVAVGQSKKERIRSINDLVGKRIVLVKGFQQTKKIQNDYPQ